METNDMAAYVVAMAEMAKQVKSEAEAKDFDMHHVPGEYFVLCDWYLDIVAMFDDTEHGYKKAFAWMKEQKPID
jgi:hypothetical protein